MMNHADDKIEGINHGLRTAFIDSTWNSSLAYRPEFIFNDYSQGKKVLSSIEEELYRCDEFLFSVAFITKGGITPLLQILKELESKNIRGRILTSNYLYFSEPEALDMLAELKNIELKMFWIDSEIDGFHTKGYIFREEDIYRIIIGSSNMTSKAVTKSREWNTKLVSTKDGAMAINIVTEFEALWNSEEAYPYFDIREEYRKFYRIIREQKRIAKKEAVVNLEQYQLKPNKMQLAFINNLNNLMMQGKDRALLISATGTGKTYASAFAMREQNPRKVLFVVHREQIAKQALKSYKRVFGSSKKYALLSGNEKDFDKISQADLVFSTMQMMSKQEIHSRFKKEEFQYIVIDEVHRAGAESYQRIMNYFTPRLWLGMTASPDRTDGFDIYSLFDHNIAYEIRLQQALEEDLLCPFHYFGITDIEIDGEVFDDTTGIRNFNKLVCDTRVDYIIEKAKYYGCSGNRVKGLVFCSRKDEARELSAKFNQRGFCTLFLGGDNSQEEREKAIERLEQEELENCLDYIFTVDIFNEGVDIPQVNQVIMLRPTESPVVFVQQLGRGLRKADGKEYVVIIDFIGNYKNNFMIPIALSGDRSYNKDTIRRYVREGVKVIPGSSTIHFDEVSKRRIYASIDSARTNDLKLIRDSYNQLKYKLGKIPSIKDFKEYGSIDISKIFDKCGSYYAFLVKYEEEYPIRLNKEEETIIEFLSRKLTSYKRAHELWLLKNMMRRKGRIFTYISVLSSEQCAINTLTQEEESVIRNLTNEFPKEEEKKKYANCVFVELMENGSYRIAEGFKMLLTNKVFADMVMELIDYGIAKYEDNYSNRYKDTYFQLYQKYTYEDVCRLLNWKRNMNAQNIGGYFYDADTKTLPVFINYDKSEDAIAYEDRFVSEDKLIALSKHPRKITSSDVAHIYKVGEAEKDNRIFLFVRKNKDDNEAKEFYFLGEIFAEGEPKPIHMETTNDDAFEITYKLDVPVRSDIYAYITGE